MHYYVVGGQPYPNQTETAKQYRNDLVNDGLLEQVSGSFCLTTEKGKAFTKMILNTPLPDQVWVDPRDGMKIE